MNMLEKVKAAGIIGAGGAGFPTHMKLNSQSDYILLNGAECEPLLRVDQQLMEIYPEKIIMGLFIAGQQVGAGEAIIGIKNKHRKVISILQNKIKELDLIGKVVVKELPDVYPAGDEQVLVYELTGRVVPEMGIPLNVGCVVINTETALNIFNAVNNEPVTMKYVTVAGDVPKPITVKVPIGTPIKELIALSGRENLDNYEVIDGGPMMGPLMNNRDGYVTKKTKGVVVLKDEHSLIKRKKKAMRAAATLNKSACEQCSLCTDLCPRHLLGHSTSPHKMVRAMSFSKMTSDSDLTVAQTCCQCNLCEYYSCPAGINPKMANVYFMTKQRANGIKHVPQKNEFSPRNLREYRMVPSSRLIARLEIKEYDKKAPLDENIDYSPETVGISLISHVGAGAIPIVAPQAKVKKGDLIAKIPEEKLGASYHSSIDGTVESIDNDIILIRRD